MKLVILVLNKIEKLESFLEQLAKQGITGATIISSTGMVKELSKKNNDYPIFSSIRMYLDFSHEESKTIFMALKDEQVKTVRKIVRDVIGDLSKPDTAVLFTLPLFSVEGVDFSE